MTSDVAVAVRVARERAGLSQAQLGKVLSLPPQTVYKIETGRRRLLWEEGKTLQVVIGFDTDAGESEYVRDALAYRRILAVIGRREAEAVEGGEL